MNKHIQTMKNALTGYFMAAKETEAKKAENMKVYLPDSAQKANDRLQAILEEKQKQAESAILEAIAAAHAEVDAASRLDGKQITDDAKLLDFDISPEDFNALVDRYKDNYTMSQLLYSYGDKQNKAAAKAAGMTGKMPESNYQIWNIPTAAGKKDAFAKIGRGALSIINAMNQKPGFGTGIDSEFVAASVEGFGEPDTISAPLYEMIS